MVVQQHTLKKQRSVILIYLFNNTIYSIRYIIEGIYYAIKRNT